jgi:hypothetical protein
MNNAICPQCKSVMIFEQDYAYHGVPICPYCGISQERSAVPLQEKFLSVLQEIKDHQRAQFAVELQEKLTALIFPDEKKLNSLAAGAILFDLIVQDDGYRRYVLDNRDLLKWFLERIASPLPRVRDEEIELLLEPGGVALADWLAFELPERWQRVAVRTFLLRNPPAPSGEFLQAGETQGKRFVEILKKFAEKTDESEGRAYERALQLLAHADLESRDRFFQMVRKVDARYAGRMDSDLLVSLPTTTLAPFAWEAPAHIQHEAPEPSSPVKISNRAPLYAPESIVLPSTSRDPADQVEAEGLLQRSGVPQPSPADVPVPPQQATSRLRGALPLVVICILLLGYGAIALYYYSFLRPLTNQTVHTFSATITSLVNTNTLLQDTATASVRNVQATASALAGGTFGASFVGQTPLTHVHAGESVPLYFILQNTGSSAWSQGSEYQFVCVSDLPQNQSPRYIASCLGATSPSPLGNYIVLPQQYHVFYFLVQIPFSAPSQTMYRTQWQLHHQTQTSDMGYITLVVL